jgi:hypothetical protein
MRLARAALVISLVVFPAAVAQAQSKEDVARADSLFNAGKALMDSGQYTDSCAKFAESKRLAPGLGVTLYLADCYERVGRNASAWTEFRSAEGLARERNDKRAEMARSRAQALESKLSRLMIVVAPTIPRSALQVLRDGIPVAQEELGFPIPVDAGAHVVVVSSLGRKTRTYDARVDADGQTATVRVDSLEDESPTPAPSSTAAPVSVPVAPTFTTVPSAEHPPESDRAAPRRWIGLGIGGLGLVGIAAGSAFGAVAMSKRDQSNGGPNPPCNARDRCDASGLSLRKDAQNDASVANIAFIAGGVALAAGAVLYITAPRSTMVVLAAAPVAGGAGALVRGSF